METKTSPSPTLDDHPDLVKLRQQTRRLVACMASESAYMIESTKDFATRDSVYKSIGKKKKSGPCTNTRTTVSPLQGYTLDGVCYELKKTNDIWTLKPGTQRFKYILYGAFAFDNRFRPHMIETTSTLELFENKPPELRRGEDQTMMDYYQSLVQKNLYRRFGYTRSICDHNYRAAFLDLFTGAGKTRMVDNLLTSLWTCKQQAQQPRKLHVFILCNHSVRPQWEDVKRKLDNYATTHQIAIMTKTNTHKMVAPSRTSAAHDRFIYIIDETNSLDPKGDVARDIARVYKECVYKGCIILSANMRDNLCSDACKKKSAASAMLGIREQKSGHQFTFDDLRLGPDFKKKLLQTQGILFPTISTTWIQSGRYFVEGNETKTNSPPLAPGLSDEQLKDFVNRGSLTHTSTLFYAQRTVTLERMLRLVREETKDQRVHIISIFDSKKSAHAQSIQYIRTKIVSEDGIKKRVWYFNEWEECFPYTNRFTATVQAEEFTLEGVKRTISDPRELELEKRKNGGKNEYVEVGGGKSVGDEEGPRQWRIRFQMRPPSMMSEVRHYLLELATTTTENIYIFCTSTPNNLTGWCATMARQVVFLDVPQTFNGFDQALSRVWRTGQTRNVAVHLLMDEYNFVMVFWILFRYYRNTLVADANYFARDDERGKIMRMLPPATTQKQRDVPKKLKQLLQSNTRHDIAYYLDQYATRRLRRLEVLKEGEQDLFVRLQGEFLEIFDARPDDDDAAGDLTLLQLAPGSNSDHATELGDAMTGQKKRKPAEATAARGAAASKRRRRKKRQRT